MVARGNAQRRMDGCGCTLRAMVAISGEGDLQALVCSNHPISKAFMCESCQKVCHKLNAALEARSFTHAVGLTPDNFHVDDAIQPQLRSALDALHEAMLQAILEFESQAPSEAEYLFFADDQSDRIAALGV
jgi:hypothetical protein